MMTLAAHRTPAEIASTIAEWCHQDDLPADTRVDHEQTDAGVVGSPEHAYVVRLWHPNAPTQVHWVVDRRAIEVSIVREHDMVSHASAWLGTVAEGDADHLVTLPIQVWVSHARLDCVYEAEAT